MTFKRFACTRRAYRAAVRAWCARHGLVPLPAAGQDVAAFLAGERGRKLSPETLKPRRYPPSAPRRRRPGADG